MALMSHPHILTCPLCRGPMHEERDNRVDCPTCGRSAVVISGGRRLDFEAFLDHTSSSERERVGLAYRFYSLAYAPLALLNMLTVWRASLGKLIRHYADALRLATLPDREHPWPSAGENGGRGVGSKVQVYMLPILDIAVGDGALTLLALKRLGCMRRSLRRGLLCLDIADDMLVQAERNLAGIPELRTVRADAGALPFADGSFETVCCYGGLHVIAHPERAAAEMRRVLKPGGIFSASILLTPPGKISGHLARRYVELGFLSTNFTRDSALDLLRSAGFTNLRPELNGRMLLVRAN